MPFGVQEFTLAIIVGTLAAIVYSLRVLVLMERRVARIETHIERAVGRVMKEEIKIEKSLKRKRNRLVFIFQSFLQTTTPYSWQY